MNLYNSSCVQASRLAENCSRSQLDIAEHSERIISVFNDAVDQCFLRLFELKANLRKEHLCADCSSLILEAMDELRFAQSEQ